MVNLTEKEIASKIIGLSVTRTKIFDALARFTNFVNQFSDPNKVCQLQVRLERLQSLWSEFVGVQADLELLDTQNDHSQFRIDFEDEFFDSAGMAKSIIDKHYNKQSSSVQNVPHSPQNITIQQTSYSNLPKIKLPEFYGSYELWLQFSDTYKSLIHNSTTLSKVEKFWYLKSCLKGDAAKLILSLEVLESNYDVAWKLLCDRYQNKRVIIQTHMKSLFNIQPINKESHILLRGLIDVSNQHLRALESLGLPVEYWDCVVIFHITSKLDPVTRREWEDFSLKLNTDNPTSNDLFSFLNKRCQILESISSTKSNSFKTENKYNNRSSALTVTNSSCIICKKDHFVFSCADFLKLNPQERLNRIRSVRACTNCLRKGHLGKDCRSSRTCNKCSLRHNTLLHLPKVSVSDQPSSNSFQLEQNCSSASSEELHALDSKALSVTNTAILAKNECILLSTANILVQDIHGNYHMCRALLDNGSQLNFITKRLYNKIQLPTSNITHSVEGFGNSVTKICQSTNIKIKSTINSFSLENISFLVTDKITKNLPEISFDSTNLQIPENITLADKNFNKSGPIDMLIGASIFWNLICVGQIILPNNSVIIQKTKLGWIVSGPLSFNSLTPSVCNLAIDTSSIQTQLEKFWKIEDYQTKQFLSREEQECEDYFLQTTSRDSLGKFVVSLPFKENVSDLGNNSFDNALKRFYNTEKRLNNNPSLKAQYSDFISEYISLNHMTEIEPPSKMRTTQTNQEFYLPHHAVLKESSSTTKLRVVFDGSAKTSSGISLNETLKVGPKIQDDLIDIIIRFRTYKYAFTGDIEKMYRSVVINENQRCFQKILWRFDSSQKISEYELNTVTYGTASAAYLAIRCLQQLAVENREQFPNACGKIASSFYVDDFLCGSDSIDEGKKLISEVDQILRSAGFNLRKWVASDKKVLGNLLSSASSADHKILTEDDATKTLGVTWNSKEDIFYYTISISSVNPVTKRSILAITASIFDPMGLIGPCVIKAKLILQTLWQLGLNWDESVPMDLHHSWIQFCEHIHFLNDIKIPRRMLCSDYTSVDFHGFCDSSQKAYGACCYLRSTNSLGEVVVQLICAKSRVAPLKTLSLPRLELCGAQLLVRLSQKVLSAINHISINNIHFWTDSTIVLSWLSLEPNQVNTFVANRTSEIQQSTSPSQWHHVPSHQNPADIISRGLDPDKLNNCNLWWFGPDFLKYDEQQWPSFPHKLPEPPEIKQKSQLVLITLSVNIDFIETFSRYTKLQRILAFCLRFINNSRTNSLDSRCFGSLNGRELNQATVVLCRMVQAYYFPEDIKCLKASKPLPRKSKILRLNPFLHTDGLIRVGGRLKFSDCDFNAKHPILLPNNAHFTILVIRHEHLRLLHSGAQNTLSAIRQNFWPINGRHLVQKVIRQCVICFRANPAVLQNQMGDLPKARVTPQRAFYTTGIDFAGPFLVKDGKAKNRTFVKCYLCIFVCFATKAAHFELSVDLSTESFLNCLKRFVSRRGICANIYTDNGTNFVGAERELRNTVTAIIKSSEFMEFLELNHITWKFSPPHGPNFGGLWESCVKAAKFHLKRIIGNAHLTYEALLTCFIQIEAVLNSRPLVPLSSDPSDIAALTPGHFLIGEPLIALPQIDVTNISENRLSHYHRMQQQVQHFWRRWSYHYLNTLQERSKWESRFPNVKVGTLVVIKDDNTAPLCWKLGRISQCFPGSDGIVRVVDIRTNSGVVKRPISKICALPLND